MIVGVAVKFGDHIERKLLIITLTMLFVQGCSNLNQCHYAPPLSFKCSNWNEHQDKHGGPIPTKQRR